jgi:hypothetical protein
MTLVETISSCTSTTTDYETVTANGVTVTTTDYVPTTTTTTVTTGGATVTVPASTTTVTSTRTSTTTDTTTVTNNQIETRTVTTTDTFTLEFITTVTADGCAVTDPGTPSYGSCSDPTIVYEYGLDGRTDYSYTTNSQADFPFRSSPESFLWIHLFVFVCAVPVTPPRRLCSDVGGGKNRMPVLGSGSC